MKKTLHLGRNLHLPLEAATETFAIVGRRGSGKTHTAVVFVEELLRVGVQTIVLDPLDVWFGLRVSKDGKAPGLPIYVAGGAHQDIPLVADAGKVLADVVVEKGLSIVLSLRHLSKGDQRRFVADFCERLYDRKGSDQYRTALHIVLDEADAFVPQRLVPGAERTYGAVDTLVRRGRASGVATTLISQRPQVIAKDVLSQTEILVSHQLTGPQDRKAIEAWIEAHDTADRQAEFMASLASLPRGTAWFWSPGFLDIFQRIEVRDRQTFDSSATPKPGQRVVQPREFAEVDLDKLTSEITATIERAKADDPRELRKQIAALKAELGKKQQFVEKKQQSVEPKRVEVLTDADRERIEKLQQAFRDTEAAIADKADLMLNSIAERAKVAVDESLAKWLQEATRARAEFVAQFEKPSVQKLLGKIAAARTQAPDISPPRQTLSAPLRINRPSPRLVARARVPVHPSGEFVVKDMHRRMLTALAEHPNGLTKRQILIITTYASSGPVSAAFADLAREGLVVSTGNLLQITDVGVAALGDYEPLPTGEALYQHLMNGSKLSTMEKALLGAVHATYPEAIRKSDILERTGYASSGPVSAAFARLVAFGYVRSSGPSLLKAADELFD